jgi:hypothetical protein
VIVSLLVEALPRAEGLATLGLPEVQRTFSYRPWKSLWTSVAESQTLQAVTATSGPLEPYGCTRRKTLERSAIMAECLRKSASPTTIRGLQLLTNPRNYNLAAFEANVEPIQYCNRHRRDVDIISAAERTKNRYFLIASVLGHPKVRPLTTPCYPLLRRSAAAFLSLLGSEPPRPGPRASRVVARASKRGLSPENRGTEAKIKRREEPMRVVTRTTS